MKIEQLPSGSYRVRKQVNKQNITVIFDHYPTETEILLAISEHLKDTTLSKENMPFYVAAKQYINLKKNVLSPRTVKEYIGQADRLSQEFTSLNVNSIEQIDIQIEINRLAENLSPKSVKNYYAFITSVLHTYRPQMVINATLPQPAPKEPYIPTDDEVKRFLNYIKDKRPKYYVLVVLAAYGLRRSEILAITGEDVTGTTLHITKAKVLNENNEWVVKTTKTPKSKRDITIPKDVADMIKERNCAFEGYPSDINKVITTACKRLNIKHFTLHKLRHYFATKLLSENVDVVTVMALGGWASTAMLQKHYAHAVAEKQEKALTHIGNIVSDKSDGS